MAEGPRNALVSIHYSRGPIVQHYLRDPIRLAVFTQYQSVTDTHTQTDGQTDTRRRHVLRLA